MEISFFEGHRLPYAVRADRVVRHAAMRREGTTSMEKFVCRICAYLYDPEKGDHTNEIPPGTSFEALPDDWRCPLCGAVKGDFARLQEGG